MSMIGRNLGHYAVTTLIGRGGMGEVYQAKDEKLGRDVAIKVLPEEFARDTDRVARFQREAKLLASLNHPNIASIYGLEECGKSQETEEAARYGRPMAGNCCIATATLPWPSR
jgi:serine/threonine protein kinase